MKLNIKGINIAQLPFEDLKLTAELIIFEDTPILLHYIDSNNSDILAYLVDFDISGYRWLYKKTTKDLLFNYLNGTLSLYELLIKNETDFLFFIDLDINEEPNSCQLIYSSLLPEKYLPTIDSYFFDAIPDFYSDYLRKYDYINRLRENSYIIKVEPSNHHHQDTVSAKDAAEVLGNITSSIEGYITVKAFGLLKEKYGDSNKINKRINSIKKELSPRISEAAYGSFEVWIAIDTLIYEGDEIDSKLKSGLIAEFKNDVLDVDYSSEEDAKIISERFKPDEIKLIYSPLVKILDNSNFKLTISDFDNKTIVKKSKEKTSPKFKNIILPPPSLEEVERELSKKNTIISVIFNLKEGDDFTKIKKSELLGNLLFKQEVAEAPYDIPSPIVTDNISISIKIPLRCFISVNLNGGLQLYNYTLDLFSEGEDINMIVADIKRQFTSTVQEYLSNPDVINEKNNEMKKYI